jgi:predicted methyltransferase
MPIRRAALLAVVCTAACHGGPVVDEASVKPGINQEYLDPALDVGKFERRFEGESREVFAQRRQIVTLLGLRPGMDVADVGAGTGLFTLLFSPQVARGTVYAVDIVPKFLGHIRDLAAQRQLTNVKTVLCSERSAGLPASSVDLVFVCDTYHHFEYPRSTLASLHEALRPGGELVIVDFIREEGQSRPWILEHVRAGLDTVRQEVEAAGFTFVRVEATPQLRETYMVRFRKQ